MTRTCHAEFLSSAQAHPETMHHTSVELFLEFLGEQSSALGIFGHGGFGKPVRYTVEECGLVIDCAWDDDGVTPVGELAIDLVSLLKSEATRTNDYEIPQLTRDSLIYLSTGRAGSDGEDTPEAKDRHCFPFVGMTFHAGVGTLDAFIPFGANLETGELAPGTLLVNGERAA